MMKLKLVVSALLIILLFSCDNQPEVKFEKSSNFNSLSPSDHGITFQNSLTFTDQLNIIDYLYYNNGGGVAIGDIDNDGLEDVFLTANQGADLLYKNQGELQFEDISTLSGVSQDPSWSSGVVIDDVNGDGWKDIYVCKAAPVSIEGTHNELYINQGNGTFTESAQEYGLDFSGFATQSSFFDYDGDGDLDMYLLCHSVHGTNSYGKISKRKVRDDLAGDRLYENRLNESEGKFVEVTEKAGIYSSAIGYGLGVVTADLNDDGWTDIYVGNDFHDNDYLYINNGDGTFTESINELMTHTSQFSMGVDAADINGDGLNDIFTTDMMPYDAKIKMKSGGNDTEQIVEIKKDFGYLTQYSRNNMQISDGSGGYSEQANMTATFASDWSWSGLLQDFDNSGSTDVFISNGIVNRPNDLDYIDYINIPENRQQEGESDAAYDQRLINQMPTLKLSNLLFLQDGDMEFTDVHSAEVGIPNYSNGAAYADLDKDGDLDIITNNVNEEISLLENKSDDHFIAFEIKEPSAKNTSITVKYGGQEQTKEYTTTRGFQSASTHFIHFGLGDYDGEVSVEVNGTSMKPTYKVDQYVQLEGGLSSSIAESISPNGTIAFPFIHNENDYDDLDQEFLMPYRYSQKGPAVVYEDFDKDGNKDLFIGNAYDQEIGYFKGAANGSFTKQTIEAFEFDARLEDIDADVFDFNQDGYEDLYVVSGGNQYNQQDQMIQDRIYMNDQNGGFYRLGISLPLTNGSTVAMGDYDGDGHDDFFVGSQNIPGGFGVSPVSFIIKNVNGQRLEIAARLKAGMVNDSKWDDVNGDGQLDLVIAGEWMPFTVLTFRDTSFVNITDELGIPDIRGLMQCVEVGDFNGDGQKDFALGNIGHNTSFQLDEKGKMKMYISDFDGNEYPEPLIFQGYFGERIPFADKMTLKKQMPVMSKLYPSYEKFAEFTSVDALLKKDIPVAEKYINNLSSLLLLSNGERYTQVELPREAQVSVINDFLWKDGSLYFVGNSKANSHALGQQLGSRGGVFSDFVEGNFTSFESMGLPQGAVSKHIIELGNGGLLIVNNGGESVVLK